MWSPFQDIWIQIWSPSYLSKNRLLLLQIHADGLVGLKTRFLATFALGPYWQGPLGTPGLWLWHSVHCNWVGFCSESALVQFHQLHFFQCKSASTSWGVSAVPIMPPLDLTWLHTCCPKATLAACPSLYVSSSPPPWCSLLLTFVPAASRHLFLFLIDWLPNQNFRSIKHCNPPF